MRKTILWLVLLPILLAGCTPKSETSDTEQEIVSSEPQYGTDYESTWGDLIESNGGEPVWGTLTPEQQELVNYPYLDKECVYYVPDGEAYHSVDWCYTLERSKNILSTDYDDAVSSGLGPCSKCVGD